MNIKIIRDAVTNLTWALRLVQFGDNYGRNDQLVHDQAEPMVEFFDTRYTHEPLGQFVSRYYLSTLLDRQADVGLSLDGGVPSWSVSAEAMNVVYQWLRAVEKSPPVPSNTALLETLRRAVKCRLLAEDVLVLEVPHADSYWQVDAYADGSTRYGSYAEEARGATGTLADLKAWELVGLLGL